MSKAGKNGVRLGKSDHGGKIVYELRAVFEFENAEDAEYARMSFEKQWGTGKLLFDSGRLDSVDVRGVAHGGYAGKSLIEIIEDQLRKQVLKVGRQKDLLKKEQNAMWTAELQIEEKKLAVLKARAEGIAWSLGVLRSSSMPYELERAMGIEIL